MLNPRDSLPVLRRARPLILYLTIFSIIYFFLTNLGPEVFMGSLINLTIALVMLFSNIFGLTASSAGNLVTISGFTLNIDASCTALPLYSIFIAGVVAFPAHNLLYKAKGLFYGIASLFLFNIVRIIAISMVGAHYSHSVFDFIHVYVSQVSFVVFVCLVWLVWLKRNMSESRRAAAFMGIFTVGTAGCILLMWATMEWYVGALAFVASVLNSIVNTGLEISRYNSDEIAFNYSGKLIGFRVFQHVFDSAIFFGLMLASGKGREMTGFLKRLIIGAVIISAIHMLVILLAGYLIVMDTTGMLGSSASWLFRSITIVAPILLWLNLKREFVKNEPVDENLDEGTIPAG